jgi:Uma2 family endonuclease
MTMRACAVLLASGGLEPGRYELLDGALVPKAAQSRRHIAAVTRLFAVLGAVFGPEHVQVRAQVGIGAQDPDATSDPEPDAAVLVGVTADYLTREPDPATEVRLVAEAADSTLGGDLTVKARLYAGAGIAEYWVVDIPYRRLVVHRGAALDGYAQVTAHGPDDTVAPLAAPAAPVRVADLLP